jgi:hypothetical protein
MPFFRTEIQRNFNYSLSELEGVEKNVAIIIVIAAVVIN